MENDVSSTELTDRSCTEKHTARNLRTVNVCSTQRHFNVTLSAVWRRLFAAKGSGRSSDAEETGRRAGTEPSLGEALTPICT
ncbi:hypothetical protein MHYP_G00035320 [Metynnis hypsauchen]